MSTVPAKICARQRIALIVSVLLLGFLTAVQLALYLTGYEFDTDLYVPGSLPTLTACLWIGATAGAFLPGIFLPGKTVCSELRIRSTVFTDVASLLSAAALAGSLLFPLILKNSGTDGLGNLLSDASPDLGTARMMLIASMIFAIPAALHFALRFAHHKSYPQSACALLFWAAFSALRVYFDMRYLLTSPRRIIHLIALIAVMLFLIAELRLSRGLATRRLYTITAASVIVLAGCDAITNLILAAMGWLSLGSELFTYLFLLTVAMYAAAGLAALCTPAKPAPIPAKAEQISGTADTDAISAPSDAVEQSEGFPASQTDESESTSESEANQ